MYSSIQTGCETFTNTQKLTKTGPVESQSEQLYTLRSHKTKQTNRTSLLTTQIERPSSKLRSTLPTIVLDLFGPSWVRALGRLYLLLVLSDGFKEEFAGTDTKQASPWTLS
jgi:hypothetical protein